MIFNAMQQKVLKLSIPVQGPSNSLFRLLTLLVIAQFLLSKCQSEQGQFLHLIV